MVLLKLQEVLECELAEKFQVELSLSSIFIQCDTPFQDAST